MNERAPWAFGVMAIVIAALAARGVLPQGAGRNPGSRATEVKEDKKDGADDAKKAKEKASTEFCPAPCLYQEFFGFQPSSMAEGWPTAAADIVKSAGEQDYTLEFLVALVPDPIDSHLSNRFDEALDALQRGIAQSGYLFDRVSLPWEGEAAKMRLYRWIPGGMLFRKVDANGQRHLLAVFLVGESPKGGVQKQAFFNALDFVAGLQSAATPKQEDKLRILGPSFSGSAESIKIALREWVSRPDQGAIQLKVEMVTGSATVENLFRQPVDPKVSIDFSRTILYDDLLQERAFEFLHNRLGWDLDDMALITELDTAYGQQSFEPQKKSRRSPLLVQFPSNLAHIRTAREKLGLQRDTSSSVASSQKSLDLSLADQDRPVDIVPQLSELSTQSNDLALAGLLRALSRERVRYIGILATDIQDQLFLAEQVRSFCPDAVVFTFDNHLLDAHPKVTKSMDGTLVLTRFPLYASPAERSMRQFTSEFQQGIYLAARRLVGKPKATLLPRDIWVAAVGNGELWPIAVQPAVSGSAVQIYAIPGAFKAELKWLVSALVLALLAVWLWRLTDPLQEAVRKNPREKVWSRGAVFLPALGAGVLWLASGVLLVFYSLSLRKLDEWQGGFLNPSLLALTYLGMTFLLAWLTRRPRHWIDVLLWISACVLGLVLLGWAMGELWFFREGAAFFYTRAGNFSSGLSPLVSLALLGSAVYAWAVFELKRRRLIVVQDLPWPLKDSPEPALAACERSAHKLQEILLDIAPGRSFWVVLALIFLLPAPRLIRGMQPIAETRAYGMLFLVIVMAVFLLCAISFYRFLMAWRLLERILDRLCNTWMLPVFSRSSSLLDWRPLKSFGLRMPTLRMTLASARQLRTLSNLGLLGPNGAALTGGAGGTRGLIDEELEHVFAAEQGGVFLDEVKARRDLQAHFDKTASLVQCVRWTSGNADLRPADEKKEPVPRKQEIEMREIETYLAVRVVAYLRYVFAHLRYTLLSATVCGLALLIAVSTYAFQPKRFLSFEIWMALLLGSLMTLRVFVQMDRNGALSAISGTDAGKVTLDRTFFSNLLTYGGIPVLGVVLTQFPAAGHLFGGWLGPLLRLVGGG